MGRVGGHEGEALGLDPIPLARVEFRWVNVCTEVDRGERCVEREGVEGLSDFVGQDCGESDEAVGGELKIREDGTAEARVDVRKAVTPCVVNEGLLIRELA